MATHFNTRTMPIDGKSYKKTEKQQKVFDQLYKNKITQLVIYGLSDVHTQTHTHAFQETRRTPGLKNISKSRNWLVKRCILMISSYKMCE